MRRKRSEGPGLLSGEFARIAAPALIDSVSVPCLLALLVLARGRLA